MKILGIETSCDETAISIVEAEGDLGSLGFRLLGSAMHSQVDLHKKYGGVYPNLAKREHQKNLPPVYEQAVENAKVKESEIEMIAVTVGPGLEPALWTGINFAEELGKKWNVPVIPANHMLGHIASVLFNNTEENSKSEIRNPKQIQNSKSQKIKFPAIALLVSGGHTELVLLKSWAEKEKLGETQDDAVGEAFDKVARMLGLPYPGGPEISALAEKARNSNIEIRNIKFPRPMIYSKDFNFSFSGLKTAVLYYLRDNPQADKYAVAREFEDAVIETLVSKTKKAIEAVSQGTFKQPRSQKVPFDTPKTLIIGGGVIANKALRQNFMKLKEDYKDLEVLIPEKELTTDNATMIAAAGYIEYLQNKTGGKNLKAQGNLDTN